jgi:xanthine dehydrogenase accessory factor
MEPAHSDAGNRAGDHAPSDAEDVLQTASAWLSGGKRVALATVVATWGSSPRPAGSQLAVREDGAFVGSVSGGCVEGAVVEEALGVMAGGQPRLLAFGVANETAWEVGLACGGKIRIYVERLETQPESPGATSGDTITRLLADRVARRSVVVATTLATGEQRLIHPFEPAQARDDERGPDPEAPALRAAAHAAAVADQSTTCELSGSEIFLRVHNPPLRLVVVGAVHIAQALCPMAAIAGFAVTVVDPRTAFATPERFPGVTLSTDWPDRALEALALDHRSAVVTLTHDPKLDEPALAVALRSGAFYIGALGSTRTQAARLGRMRGLGFDDATLARIHGPVGLDIGARSAAEIAVSILAQIVERLRRQPS